MAEVSSAEALQAFHDKCRQNGHRPAPVEVARFAKSQGIGLEAFLAFVSRSVDRGNRVGSELGEFVVALASDGRVSNVMEIGEDGAVYALGLIGGGVPVRYSSRSAELAEAVAVLSDPGAFVVEPPGALDEARKFDLIVAHPPVSYRPSTDSDGFGSEIAMAMAASLSARGRLVWISGRGVLGGKARTPEILSKAGLHLAALLDLPAGWLADTSIEGALLVFTHCAPERKLIGLMREQGSGRTLGEALLRGPTKKTQPDFLWVDRAAVTSFRDVEQRRLMEGLMPKGRLQRKRIAELLTAETWAKADRPPADDSVDSAFLFVPEYPGSLITTDSDEQTVSPKAVYRFSVNRSAVDVRFLARLLNSPFGKALRQQVSGGTIPRISPQLLIQQIVPIPDSPTQQRIVAIHDDVDVLKTVLADHLKALEGDWRRLDSVSEELDELKAVTDSDRRIEDWARELPYPLATVYRRYRVAPDPLERLDAALHFFEVVAVYLAAMGLSHLRALRSDAAAVLDGLAYPPARSAGIDRADFGFWIQFAQGCGKEIKRTLGDPALRVAASEYAGPALFSAADALQGLGEVAAVLNGPREIRNGWKAHGGRIKPVDAERIDNDMQASIKALYTRCAPLLRRMRLVRIGRCDVGDELFTYEAEVLRGSDPTFERASIEVRRRLKSKTLAFWHVEQNDVVADVPFFRLGTPMSQAERTVYVYSRVEGDGLRWVSYQDAEEQIIRTDADAMRGIVRDRQ